MEQHTHTQVPQPSQHAHRGSIIVYCRNTKWGMYIPLTELGGGPSTVRETRFIPLRSTSPRLLFSSLSGPLFFGLIFLNSSQSASTRFMCRSKAKKVPMNMRPSRRVIRMRYCMYWLIFPLPDCREANKCITATRYQTNKQFPRKNVLAELCLTGDPLTCT